MHESGPQDSDALGAGTPLLAWPPAVPAPALAPGAVHVWGWSIAASSVSPALDLLSPGERARADRFRAEKHRQRFIEAHAGLRRILAAYLSAGARDVEMAQHPEGKPRLADDSRIRFNLSHSRDLALLAVSNSVEVGVDVEFIRPISEAIAERFFSAPEIAGLAALPPADYLPAFYACWTRKEAFLKGLGTGLAGGLASFSVSLPGDGQPRLWDEGSTITAGWSLQHLEPAPGCVGALAVHASECELSCYTASF